MLASLELPKDIKAKIAAATGERPECWSLFASGRYHIVRSFFTMVLALKKAGREFSVVFRTFGSDTGPVVSEFNA